MLVSAKEMLTKAKAGKYAVGQFNTLNGQRLFFRLPKSLSRLLSSAYPRVLENICAVLRPS